MTWSAEVPYDELPSLPPRADVETKRVLKATVEARAALAALDQAMRRIPNPAVLVNSIPLLEAQASSEIENIVTTADELFRFANDDGAAANPAVKETLRYRTALLWGFELITQRPLTISTATEICSIVKQHEMRVRVDAGTMIGNPATRRAVYTPPVGESLIRDKMTNWEAFVHGSTDLDPLVVMAIAHYQFEAIHPFADGNGRTGRILNVLLLLNAGILSQPILYLSRYFIENKDAYYRLLLGVTASGEWEAWILYVLEGLRRTAVQTIETIDAIHELEVEMRGVIRSVTSAGSNSDLVAVLFEQTYCRIANVVDRCGVSRPTATSWLNALTDAGMLESHRAGRERLFVNSKFFALLTRGRG
jgi:Fic family protein